MLQIIKIKNLCYKIDATGRMKRPGSCRKKVFARHVSDRGLCKVACQGLEWSQSPPSLLTYFSQWVC
jgi:hypothetical protein